jgi:hypothetical protein
VPGHVVRLDSILISLLTSRDIGAGRRLHPRLVLSCHALSLREADI